MKRNFVSWVVVLLVAAASAGAEYVYAGQWGSFGAGNGQFNYPNGIGVAPASGNVYVADTQNDRVQYFRWKNEPAVAPASLGKIKALFK